MKKLICSLALMIGIVSVMVICTGCPAADKTKLTNDLMTNFPSAGTNVPPAK